MTESEKPGLLLVARSTPHLSGRTRKLIRALSGRYRIRAIAESPDGIERASYDLDGAKVKEIVLPYPDRHLWHISGAIRVIFLNIYASFMALRDDYAVVVCSDSIYCLAGILSKLLLRRKFVYNSHEVMWALGNPGRLNGLLGWSEKIAVQVSDFWLVPSEARAELILKKHGLDKRYVVYENFPIDHGNPLDRNTYREKLYQAGVPTDKIILMFQGSLVEKRGLAELIQASESGLFHLVIQGRGQLMPFLHDIANPNITLLGPCPSNEVVSWLAAADISFVYYENDCLNSAYASSNKFYASVFAGTPVICNPLPAFTMFADQYGGVAFIDSLDPEAITDRVKQIMNDPEFHGRLEQDMRSARDELLKVPQELKISQAFMDLV